MDVRVARQTILVAVPTEEPSELPAEPEEEPGKALSLEDVVVRQERSNVGDVPANTATGEIDRRDVLERDAREERTRDQIEPQKLCWRDPHAPFLGARSPEGKGRDRPQARVGVTLVIATVPPADFERSRVPAWYASTVRDFLAASPDEVLGELTRGSRFDVELTQRNAWQQQITLLREALLELEGWLFLEFDIPRLGTRVDAVLTTGSAVMPIEFKMGESRFERAAYDQAWDYALDLKNFHAASHHAAVFPVLVASEAPKGDAGWEAPHDDGVRPPRRCGPAQLRAAIDEARRLAEGDGGAAIDGPVWGTARYQPTPTIIQAAQTLFARHTVEAISRNDAGAKNLAVTSVAVDEIITAAERERFKAIVFVTGVPGAGKTLVGLSVATRHRRTKDATHAVFLSGNGPLVDVLREALTRDELARRRQEAAKGEVSSREKRMRAVRKGAVALEVKPFIQNVHHFRDEGVRTSGTREAPHDHVVIFDEAQRAWDLPKTADFMRKRKGLPAFDRSEPQFLIEYMDRHLDWAVVICLVGGGQEINTGEAGISTWLDAVREHFPSWRAFISPELSDREYAAGHALERLRGVAHVQHEAALHLSVSMRSFRAERVSAFVKALLDLEEGRARELLRDVLTTYPVAVTRDLDAARRWVRAHARGSERYGLVASSSAQRLKPHAVDVRVNVDPVKWFLGDRSDTRASWYLEDAATEYQVQGLELDWVCVTWDADLRWTPEGWMQASFRGDRWMRVRSEDRRRFLLNAYRVLLTRARQGMVVFVPPGERDDPTRQPDWYDAVYEYLTRLGVSVA